MGHPHDGSLGHGSAASGPLDQSVTDPPSGNRERNLKIARNEAARETRRGMRLTAWAASLVLILVLIAAFSLLR